MAWDYTNDYSSTILAYLSGATSLTVVSVTGLPTSGRNFILKVDNEYFLCTSYTGFILTVTGGQAGSTPTNHSLGAAITGCWIVPSVLDGIRSDQSLIGTYANLPAAGMKSGDRYKCTDSKLELIYSGGVWNPFVFGSLVTLPVDSAFAWVNQGSASTTSKGKFLFSTPNAAGSNLRIRIKSLPSPPYTIEIGFISLPIPYQYAMQGLALRNSGNGKLLTVGPQQSGNNQNLNVYGWNSPTAGSGAVIQPGSLFPTMWWFKLYDDATTRHHYISNDGVDWVEFYSVGNTNFVVPDSYGYFVDC